MGMFYLAGAIIAEVFGTSMMKLTAMLNSKRAILGIILGYGISFYLLSLALISIPLSFAYAVWSGIGTALTAVIGFLVFKEDVQPRTVIGIALLIVGIVLMRL